MFIFDMINPFNESIKFMIDSFDDKNIHFYDITVK